MGVADLRDELSLPTSLRGLITLCTADLKMITLILKCQQKLLKITAGFLKTSWDHFFPFS